MKLFSVTCTHKLPSNGFFGTGVAHLIAFCRWKIYVGEWKPGRPSVSSRMFTSNSVSPCISVTMLSFVVMVSALLNHCPHFGIGRTARGIRRFWRLKLQQALTPMMVSCLRYVLSSSRVRKDIAISGQLIITANKPGHTTSTYLRVPRVDRTNDVEREEVSAIREPASWESSPSPPFCGRCPCRYSC